MRGKDRQVTEFPLLPQAIPEDKLGFVDGFTKRILAELSEDLRLSDHETQMQEVGNLIYTDLHDEGFSDRLIVTVRDLIVSEFRDQKRGE